MTTSIMIHSGLSRLQITRCWYYQKYRDAGWKEALMISYAWRKHTRRFLYLVDENYIPKAWRMGQYYSCWRIETSWEDWKTFQTISKSLSHKGILDLKLENVQTGKSIEEINNGIDPLHFISFILYRNKFAAEKPNAIDNKQPYFFVSTVLSFCSKFF
jgi:hypothetical protein